MHVVACVRISFLVEAKSHFIVWMDHICLTIHLSMDIWIASSSWLLEIMLLWTWVYKYLFKTLLSVLLGELGCWIEKFQAVNAEEIARIRSHYFCNPEWWMLSDDHRWPLRLLGERNFSLGESQWMSQTDAPWTHWSILMRRERDIHTDTEPTGCCAVTSYGERHRYTERTNEMLCVICWSSHHLESLFMYLGRSFTGITGHRGAHWATPGKQSTS